MILSSSYQLFPQVGRGRCQEEEKVLGDGKTVSNHDFCPQEGKEVPVGDGFLKNMKTS
jgi:hypothetical protein